MNINGLTDEEQEVIAQAIRNGGNRGVINHVYWLLDGENMLPSERDNVAEMIRHECVMGNGPEWELRFRSQNLPRLRGIHVDSSYALRV